MLISAIVAVSENNVIGRDGHLPWHLSADLKRFKAITTGHSIILGRKNYDDIGRPLPNRTNYVLTRNADFSAPGCVVCNDLESAIQAAENAGETECFVIGGAAIYDLAMPLTKKLYLTKVHADVDGDVFFPQWGSGWHKISEEAFPADEKNDFPTTFEVWER